MSFFKKLKKEGINFDIAINGNAFIDELINSSNKNLYVGKYGFLVCENIHIKEGYINGKIQGDVKADKLYIYDNCIIRGDINAEVFYVGKKEGKIVGY